MNPPLYPYLIRDPLHGDITFSETEKKVIDHPLFQRLRGISQLGFLRFVFPSACHSRFEHSLGVMHLAGKALSSLIRNQERVYFKSYPMPEELTRASSWLKTLSSPMTMELIRLAALVHDLGHGPYSHASEILTEKISISTLERLAPAWLREAYQKKKARNEKVKHEWISALMCAQVFSDLNLKTGFDVQEVVAILDPDVEIKRDSFLAESGLRPLLHDLIAGEMDADRMDYLRRDSFLSGVNYGLYDADRLFSSLLFAVDEKNCPNLILHRQGLHAFEDFLFSRYQMYLQIYTHKTNTSFECMLKRLTEEIHFEYPLAVKDFIHFRDASFPDRLQASVHEETGQNLFNDLFENRKPWKMVYESMRFSERPVEAPAFFSRPEISSLGTAYHSQRKLSSLGTGLSHQGKQNLRLWGWDELGLTTRLFDLHEKSHVLRSFQHYAVIDRFFVPEQSREAFKSRTKGLTLS
jgi:hypothetical protein